MDVAAVISWGLVALVTIWAMLWTWDRIKPAVGIAYGLFVAPVVESVKSFKARYLLMPEDRPDYYVDEPVEEVVPQTDTPYRSVPDTNQLEPASSGLARTGTVPTDEALIRHLAGLQKPSGTWALSANKIAAAVGGERESALVIIREVRGIVEPIKDGLRVKDSSGERLISRA